jgi:hypothetical protein
MRCHSSRQQHTGDGEEAFGCLPKLLPKPVDTLELIDDLTDVAPRSK